MSGNEYIYIGAAILVADIVLFAIFQIVIRHNIKSFKEIWKKLD